MKKTEHDESSANPGYAVFQLSKALHANEHHEDVGVRDRAAKKVLQWTKVLTGMLSGSLDVGSRAPVRGVPGWATLEVVTGGFATGALLAGGPLKHHEREMLAPLEYPEGAEPRAVLNSHFVTDRGLERLQEYLSTGRYEINVPEEGALLVIAWLVKHGHGRQARAVLEAIGPHFSTLRFFPAPTAKPLGPNGSVRLQDLRASLATIENIAPNPRILAQKEAIEIWTPMYDRLVGLFLETVEGEPPTLTTTESAPDTSGTTSRSVHGGWPCQRYPDGWHSRARDLLREYAEKRTQHSRCGNPEHRRSSFRRLRDLLDRCVDHPSRLTGRDVGTIRVILARYITKRGLPGSTALVALRGRQLRQTSGPTHYDLSRVLLDRLAGHSLDDGLTDLSEFVGPVTRSEAQHRPHAEGAAIPDAQVAKLRRCISAPMETLVELGVIGSGETLARVLPQLTSRVHAAMFDDPELRALCEAIYLAFRRRRSLLLLDLRSQNKLQELPWVEAVEPFRTKSDQARTAALDTLTAVTSLTLTAFPEALVPNKLLVELRALSANAGLGLPLVDELAADIFMGDFSAKYLRAAQSAARLLKGSLYESYYGLDFGRVLRIDDVKKARFGAPTSQAFATLCRELSGIHESGWNVPHNGMIIEQAQILTTQNLAVLFDACDLHRRIGSQLGELAQRCFSWICRRQQMKITEWHGRLIMIKNTAYAWRQMVFYLAMLPRLDVAAFLDWARSHLEQQRPEFGVRFRPAVSGLETAASGKTLSSSVGRERGRTHMFLGWTTGRHWLLE